MGLSALGVRGSKSLGDAVIQLFFVFFVERMNVVLIEMTAELLGWCCGYHVVFTSLVTGDGKFLQTFSVQAWKSLNEGYKNIFSRSLVLAYLLIDLDKKSEARQMGEVLIGEMRWSCVFAHLTCKPIDHIINVVSIITRLWRDCW